MNYFRNMWVNVYVFNYYSFKRINNYLQDECRVFIGYSKEKNGVVPSLIELKKFLIIKVARVSIAISNFKIFAIKVRVYFQKGILRF